MTRKNYLSIADVADRIESSTDFVRDEITRGKLTAHRFGHRIAVHISDFAEYLSHCRMPCAAEQEAKRKIAKEALR
jgi:excisionase family DNA binding protein